MCVFRRVSSLSAVGRKDHRSTLFIGCQIRRRGTKNPSAGERERRKKLGFNFECRCEMSVVQTWMRLHNAQSCRHRRGGGGGGGRERTNLLADRKRRRDLNLDWQKKANDSWDWERERESERAGVVEQQWRSKVDSLWNELWPSRLAV